ncbi:MAG TPA: hypothetical protein VHQ03_07195 [Candidatus Dormibacteraeota bacterium]|nr:hypothetical protein [Candidatus Dormibacteraeota bacterium]
MRSFVLGITGLLAAAGAGTGFFVGTNETAHINIWIPANYLARAAEVHGSTMGGQFKTERVSLSRTETALGSATGVASTPATYAAGYVVFHYSCIGLPNCTPTPVQSGREVCAPNPSGYGAACYLLQSTVTCFCGESVAVRAAWPGVNFNTRAHTVNYIEANSTGETVDNPAPISGGANAASSPVVQQSDLDVVRSSLTSQLKADLRSAFRVKSRGWRYVVDSEPSIQLSGDVNVGAHNATFHVTASGTLGATAFLDADAMSLIGRSLDGTVPSGYQLTGPPVVTGYAVHDSNSRGDVTVTGTATGYVITSVSTDALRARLRGLDPASARRLIQSAAPGSVIEIRVDPVPAPWLPMTADRISIVIVAGLVPTQ